MCGYTKTINLHALLLRALSEDTKIIIDLFQRLRYYRFYSWLGKKATMLEEQIPAISMGIM